MAQCSIAQLLRWLKLPPSHACPGGLYMPLDSKGEQTVGCAFIEFSSPQVRSSSPPPPCYP